MKKLAILGVLALVLGMVCGVLPAQAADSPPNWDICGTWNGWSYYAGTTYNFAMTVTTQNPTTGVFGGTMLYPAYGIIATVTGKVSGDTLTFKRQDNGSTYWAQFSGGVGVTSMSGTWVDIDGKTGPWQASGTATFIPRYDNYMQSLAITSAPTPVVAGDTVTVEAAVRANTDVDVHFEFKGRFSWGDWVYDSKIVSLTSVDRTVTYNPSAILTVPLKAILDAEAETTFYYYVYATLPGDPWSGLVWGRLPK